MSQWLVTVAQTATLTVTLASNVVSEAAGTNATQATIQIDQPLTNSLTIRFFSSDKTEIAVHPAVTIPAGSNNITVSLETVNDGAIDGQKTVVMTVSADGFPDVTTSLHVTDDDTPTYRSVGGRLCGPVPPGTNYVTSDIVVEGGCTLIVPSSCTLLFTNNTGLRVDGTLIAEAEATSVIRFTSAMTVPTNGSWKGIGIFSTGQPKSILENVEIAYAKNGLFVQPAGDNPSLLLTRSTIHHSQSNGVFVFSGLIVPGVAVTIPPGAVQISDNRIYSNGRDGIYLSCAMGCHITTNSTAVLKNELFDNVGAGIEFDIRVANPNCGGLFRNVIDSRISGNWIHSNQTGIIGFAAFANGARGWLLPTIDNNLITYNRNDGIAVDGLTLPLAQIRPVIINNTIARNGGAGIAHTTNVNPGFSILNNLIIQNSTGIVAHTSLANLTNYVVGFNDVWGSTSRDWMNYPENYGIPTATNLNGTACDAMENISIDPIFSVNGLNFRLQLTSPAVDGGTVDTAPATDFEGENRRGFPDIGYDEMGSVRLALVSPPSQGSIAILAFGGRGTPFTLESTTNLQNWANGPDLIMSNRTIRVSLPVSPSVGPVFFRARIH